MLADIYGKGVLEMQGHEDSLTSAVFGHLRYLPPALFWEALFAKAMGMADSSGREITLIKALSNAGGDLRSHSTLKAHFWSRHPEWGEPDLFLCFSGGEAPPVIILVEVKWESDKSGEDDQLVRYLQVLDDLNALRPSLMVGEKVPLSFLVYLTPRETVSNLWESFHGVAPGQQAKAKERLFRLRWQDVAEVAREVAPTTSEPTTTILSDVARFLRVCGLEYFDGFRHIVGLARLQPEEGRFYTRLSEAGAETRAETVLHFSGFTHLPDLEMLKAGKGSWAL